MNHVFQGTNITLKTIPSLLKQNVRTGSRVLCVSKDGLGRNTEMIHHAVRTGGLVDMSLKCRDGLNFIADVNDGINLLGQTGCESIIAFGDADTMNVAKAIAYRISTEKYSWKEIDRMDFGKLVTYSSNPIQKIPLICIPSTYCQGSEISSVWTGVDFKENMRYYVNDPCVSPNATIVDAGLIKQVQHEARFVDPQRLSKVINMGYAAAIAELVSFDILHLFEVNEIASVKEKLMMHCTLAKDSLEQIQNLCQIFVELGILSNKVKTLAKSAPHVAIANAISDHTGIKSNDALAAVMKETFKRFRVDTVSKVAGDLVETVSDLQTLGKLGMAEVNDDKVLEPIVDRACEYLDDSTKFDDISDIIKKSI